MIARGDLMNDVGVFEMFSYQKQLVQYTSITSTIMATEMLQSMTSSITPFRAEISDVGNAILDGCSAIMLSSETASGKYPVECVNTMRMISLNAEKYLKIEGIPNKEWTGKESRSEMHKRGVYLEIK